MDNFSQDLEKAYGKESFLDYLEKIKKGDVLLRDEFIRANKHFILNVISRIMDKSVITEGSTEYNVGLSAFNYSIDNFDKTGTDDFYTYSEHIIKEWVLDVINVEASKQSDPDENSREYLSRKFEDCNEISLLKNRLWEFGITLRDLYFLAPQDIDSIRSALKVAYIVTANDILFNKLVTQKSLPIEELYDKSVFQKKFIDRNKEYIISLCLIIKSNLKVLHSYLKNIASNKEFSDNVGIILEQYKKEAIIMNFQGQFTVIRIKSSGKNMGKQIFLDSSNSLKLAEKSFFKYSMAIGGMIAAVMVITFFSRYVIFNNTEKTVSNDKINQHAINGSTPVKASNEPTSTTGIQPTSSNNAIIPEATSVVEQRDPIPAVKPDATKRRPVNTPINTLKPVKKPKEAAGWKAFNATSKPVSSPVKAKSTAAPKVIAASGVPGAIGITASSSKVGVGDYIILEMNMDGGNNGTSLNLLKNGQLIRTVSLKDSTPAPQSWSIALKADAKGQYTYSFKLSNRYGASSSPSITIVVE